MSYLNAIIGVGWVIFWLGWLSAAFSSKKSASYSVGRFAGLRLGIFLLALLVIRVSGRRANLFPGQHAASGNEALQALGFILFVVGLAFAIWARIYLGKNWGLPMSTKQDPELVTSGPYRYVRHPIYTGILTAMIGTAIATSLYWLILVLFVGAYFIYSAFVEEKNMASQFPTVYPGYKQRSKMLVPFIF